MVLVIRLPGVSLFQNRLKMLLFIECLFMLWNANILTRIVALIFITQNLSLNKHSPKLRNTSLNKGLLVIF